MTTQRILRFGVGAAITAAVLFLVWYFSQIVIFILIAAVLAIMFRPLIKVLRGIQIREWQIPQWLAASITLVVIWLLFGFMFGVFVPIFISEINQLSSLDFNATLKSIEEPLINIQNYLNQTFSLPASDYSISEAINKAVKDIVDYRAINSAFSSIITIIADGVIAIFSVSFITFFFLRDDKLFNNMVSSLFPDKYYDNVIHALDSITVLLFRYFVGIIAQSILLAIMWWASLSIFGMDRGDALFIGLIYGVMNIIPYAGPIIAGVVALFLGAITPIDADLFYTIMVIVGTWLGVKGIDDFFIQPALYSERVKAHPLEIFLVILIAGWVGGIVGMMLAVPSYTVLRVFAKEFFSEVSLVRKLTQEI
ncbi:MAG: AI-2E family transporter [Rikenellaceae bacterium]